jgi:hypothetical protein
MNCFIFLLKDPKRGFTKLYVCNYGPSGNLVGTAMYKIGFPGMTACKACAGISDTRCRLAEISAQ